MPGLILTFLGAFESARNSQPVTGFEYDKVRALLAYLAVEADRPHRRETLAGLLWPNRPEGNARQNLSQALFILRRALGNDEARPPFLFITPQTLQFNQLSDYQLDVATFTNLLLDCQAHHHLSQELCESCLNRLERAATLYRGNFLEGFSLSDCPAFEEWVVLHRERLSRLALEILYHLGTYFEGRAEYEPALHYAWRQVELEPWSEEAHQQLMRLLAWSGQRGAALAQYETCRRLLLEELGVEPAAETTALYRLIRDDKLHRKVDERRRDYLFPAPLSAGPVVPFVAREHELAQLKGFLHGVLAGQGSVVFVTGGPGRGKTALLQAFARSVHTTQPDLIVVGGKGNSHTGSGDPYLPFREILALLTGDVKTSGVAGAISHEYASQLWNVLPLSIPALLEFGPDLIGTLLPAEALLRRVKTIAPQLAESTWLPPLKEHIARQAARRNQAPRPQSDLFEQYTQVLHALACQKPLLLLLDDLHWADLGSINLLFHLGRSTEGSQILIVGAYRPAEVAIGYAEGRHPLEPVINEFKSLFGANEIDLSRVEESHFIDKLLDLEPNCLGQAFRQTLYRQTKGHPLFTVELLRGMQERGDLVQDEQGRWRESQALNWRTLPARVEAVIAERVNRLPQPLQEILTAASVEGEIFTAEVVAQVQGGEPQEIVHRLGNQLERVHRLVQAESTRRLADRCLSQYRFRHFLVQQYLYQQLDPAERMYLHEAVGLALERLHQLDLDEIVVQLAHHFQEAGLTGKAVDYLGRAGERAVRLSANEEAITHFSRALALLAALPDSPGRARQEIDLQLGLAVSYLAGRGYGAPEVGCAYVRAQELCQQMGQTAQLFPVLWVTHSFYGIRAEFQQARDLAERFFSLAGQTQDPLLLAQAHYMLGHTRFCMGELVPAQAALEQMITFYDPRQHQGLASTYGHDIGVDSLAWSSWALWLLGYPDRAWQRSQQALALASDLAHPLTQACALGFASMIVYNCRRNAKMIQDLAEDCLRLSTEHGFPYWLAHGTICRGWALAEQGCIETGLTEMRRGMADRQALGVELTQTLFLTIMAEEYGKTGQSEAGLSLLAEAMEIVQQRQERFYEAEIHRLRGELLLKQAEAEAESSFQQALAVARRQQAKSLELRAAMSLGRLWRKQGQLARARATLEEIYGWFSEGFDTADLREARALLVELSADLPPQPNRRP